MGIKHASSRLVIKAAAIVMVVAGTSFAAHAAGPQKVEQLPRVVVSGKSIQTAAGEKQQLAVLVHRLPRVVIEGRSLGADSGTRMASNRPGPRRS